MVSEDRAVERVAYLEQIRIAYEDKFHKETLYKNRLTREKFENRSKFRMWAILTGICVLLTSGGVIMSYYAPQANNEMGAQVAKSIGAIFAVVGTVFEIMGAVAIVICLWRLIHYGRRFNKEIDNRDYLWRSYADMERISEERLAEVQQQLADTVKDLDINRSLIRKNAKQALDEYESGEYEAETISMSELYYVKETAAPALPNPDEKNALEKTW